MSKAIVKEVQAAGGMLTLDDLKNYNAVSRPALKSKLDDMTLLSCPPPTSGPVLAMILNILDGKKSSFFSFSVIKDSFWNRDVKTKLKLLTNCNRRKQLNELANHNAEQALAAGAKRGKTPPFLFDWLEMWREMLQPIAHINGIVFDIQPNTLIFAFFLSFPNSINQYDGQIQNTFPIQEIINVLPLNRSVSLIVLRPPVERLLCAHSDGFFVLLRIVVQRTFWKCQQDTNAFFP